jgi:hypothetical protein
VVEVLAVSLAVVKLALAEYRAVVVVIKAVAHAAELDPAALVLTMAAAAERLVVTVLAMAVLAVYALFGPVQLVHSHQLIQVTCNGTLYSN